MNRQPLKPVRSLLFPFFIRRSCTKNSIFFLFRSYSIESEKKKIINKTVHCSTRQGLGVLFVVVISFHLLGFHLLRRAIQRTPFDARLCRWIKNWQKGRKETFLDCCLSEKIENEDFLCADEGGKKRFFFHFPEWKKKFNSHE